MKRRRHPEQHRSAQTGWLRAAVLGSNDAIVSTAGLMMGVGAADASRTTVLVAGFAGLVSGAMSMAVGEFVSVSSQRDTERADIETERRELETSPESELAELAGIYHKRGLSKDLALEVAQQLTAHDQLGAHLRDELGIEVHALSRPLQAAWISAASFATFALLPLAGVMLAPDAWRLPALAIVTLLSLVALGALGGRLSGAPIGRACLRVALGGALALAITASIGRVLNVAGL